MSGVVDAPGTFSPHLLVGTERFQLRGLKDQRGRIAQYGPCLPVSYHRPHKGKCPRVFELPCSTLAAVEWSDFGSSDLSSAGQLSLRGPELTQGKVRLLCNFSTSDFPNGSQTRRSVQLRQPPLDSYPDTKQTDYTKPRTTLPRHIVRHVLRPLKNHFGDFSGPLH